MTLTYLRGGLSTCSVVSVSVPYVFLSFIKSLMQLCKNFFQSFKNHGSYVLFLEPLMLAQLLLGSPLLLRLSATLSFDLKLSISNVNLSLFLAA